MHDTLLAACKTIRDHFIPAEATADRAAAQTARLLATMLDERVSAGLSIGTGAPLIRRLAKSLTAQLEARDEFIMAHKLAISLPRELGIDPMLYGDTEDCPPDDPETKRYYGSAQVSPNDAADGSVGKIVRLAKR